ncbi:Protein CBG26964 [Caenorhabditis briggsae]|uniref:Protein CBG26964 n=1 Tax=Caenorhabditis briggsae TaxID=6238 RepID=B6IET0_CAEBR|nr:Protein CBG26964 [Caenorhabditis briggsae]CAR98410.1 Protein CBG26964 [Caenorhabditis briggsae]
MSAQDSKSMQFFSEMLKIAVLLAVVAVSSSLSIVRLPPVDPTVDPPVDPIEPTIDVPLPWYPWYPCYPYYPMPLEGLEESKKQ